MFADSTLVITVFDKERQSLVGRIEVRGANLHVRYVKMFMYPSRTRCVEVSSASSKLRVCVFDELGKARASRDELCEFKLRLPYSQTVSVCLDDGCDVAADKVATWKCVPHMAALVGAVLVDVVTVPTKMPVTTYVVDRVLELPERWYPFPDSLDKC
jgi:hypothetical protein